MACCLPRVDDTVVPANRRTGTHRGTAVGTFKNSSAKVEYERAYDALEAVWPLPSSELDVDTSFGPTRVRRCGTGTRTPLVMLHGLNGTGLSWHGVVTDLATDRIVYAPDVIGTAGRSVQTAPLTKPDDYGTWGKEVLAGLDLDRAHLFGYSEGAWFATLLAGSAPDRLASVTLGEGITTLVRPAAGMLARMVATAAFPTARNFARLEAWLSPGVQLSAQDRALARAATRYQRRTPWPDPVADSQLQAITAPMLAFFGAETRLGDPAVAGNRLTEHVPDVQVELVPDGGHGVLWQFPDRVLPLVTQFLRTHDTAG